MKETLDEESISDINNTMGLIDIPENLVIKNLSENGKTNDLWANIFKISNTIVPNKIKIKKV